MMTKVCSPIEKSDSDLPPTWDRSGAGLPNLPRDIEISSGVLTIPDAVVNFSYTNDPNIITISDTSNRFPLITEDIGATGRNT